MEVCGIEKYIINGLNGKIAIVECVFYVKIVIVENNYYICEKDRLRYGNDKQDTPR